MYKQFDEPVSLIEENCNYDNQFSMYRYNKDRTFNEMRRDVYYHMYSNGYNYSNIELLKCYTDTKNELKKRNKLLHDLFLNNKTKIYNIVEDYNIVYLNKIPKAFKKEILNGRFILYNGNSICFLCCDDMYFYLLDWRGS
jgi:hypothetical protein